MTDHDDAATAQTRRPALSALGRAARTKTGIALLVIVALVLTVLIVNQLTPRPYVALFRAVAGIPESTVVLGPYADDAASVAELGVIDVAVDGYPDATLTLYAPPGAGESLPVILWIHGGGWVGGSADQVADYPRLLASNGYVVANLEYALAPEHPYPAAVTQSVAALDALAARADEFGGDASRLFVGGNSAGAQISSQVGAVVTNAELRQAMGLKTSVAPDDLRGLILFNGVYDFATVGDAGFPGFGTYAWSYFGVKDYADDPAAVEASMVRHVTADFPASFVTAGDADPLEGQSYEFHAAARSAGVDVVGVYWSGTGADVGHDYMYDLDTPQGQEVYEGVVAFLAEQSR